MQKVIKSHSYDEQREHPLHPSFTSELTSHLQILFLKALRFFADLTSEDKIRVSQWVRPSLTNRWPSLTTNVNKTRTHCVGKKMYM